MLLVKVFCSEQIMALYIIYKPEGGQMISAINTQVLAKLHLGSERAKIREVLNKEKLSFQFTRHIPATFQLCPS